MSFMRSRWGVAGVQALQRTAATTCILETLPLEESKLPALSRVFEILLAMPEAVEERHFLRHRGLLVLAMRQVVEVRRV